MTPLKAFLFALAFLLDTLAPPALAATEPPWQGPLPNDPRGVLAAFIRADAWGLQTSSAAWHWVGEMTVWQDGPGWDTTTLVDSAEIASPRIGRDEARFTVRYHSLGTVHTDGYGQPVLDTGSAGLEQKVFKLVRVQGRWKVAEPQDQPHLSVGYVLGVQIPAWCGARDCSNNAAYRFLVEHQAACAASPIPLNRSCAKSAGGRAKWKGKRAKDAP